jgi:hypothetical protein
MFCFFKTKDKNQKGSIVNYCSFAIPRGGAFIAGADVKCVRLGPFFTWAWDGPVRTPPPPTPSIGNLGQEGRISMTASDMRLWNVAFYRGFKPDHIHFYGFLIGHLGAEILTEKVW